MRNLLIALAAASAAFAAGPRKDPVPLFFIENQGQAPPAVRFMAQGSGMTAWFSPQEILFRVAKTGLELRFLGAQPAPVIEGLDPLEARANFLTGREAEWRTEVPLYRAVA